MTAGTIFASEGQVISKRGKMWLKTELSGVMHVCGRMK